MIDLYEYDHVYTVAPPLWFNKDATVKVKMRVAPQEDVEKQARMEAVLDMESRGKKAHEFIGAKVVSIEGLSVGGVEVTTYEELRKRGPNELLKWISIAVFSTQMLSESEIKN